MLRSFLGGERNGGISGAERSAPTQDAVICLTFPTQLSLVVNRAPLAPSLAGGMILVDADTGSLP